MTHIVVNAIKGGGVSVVSDPGIQNVGPAKIRTFKAGSGIKLVDSNDIIEVRNTMFKKHIDGFSLFDPNFHFLRSIIPGPGFHIDVSDHRLILSCDALSSVGKHTKFVTTDGKLKTIKAGKRIQLDDKKDHIEINSTLGTLHGQIGRASCRERV